MSGRVVGWAYDQVTGSSTTKAVLVKLADNANDEGECWPSLATMERQTEMSRSTLKAHLKKLEDIGLIMVERRREGTSNLSNRYLLQVDRVGRETAHPGAGDGPGVGRETAPNLQLEPSIEPSEESPLTVPPVEQAVSIWNETAERAGLAKVQKLTDTRRSSLKKRLAECGGVDGWRAACEKVEDVIVPERKWRRGMASRLRLHA